MLLRRKKRIDNNIVLDLFCGTGTIGQILAVKRDNTQIVGVDIVESAIENAKENAKRNGIEGVKFYAADVGKFLKNIQNIKGKFKRSYWILPVQALLQKHSKRLLIWGQSEWSMSRAILLPKPEILNN